jgi:pimeloyl-ACP methyl ester carboxylesterase
VTSPADRIRLVLLPGMLNNASLWARVAPALVDRCDLVTPVWDRQHSIAEMAQLALDRAGAGPFAVLGFSMGGFVAQEILATVPERVIGLALLATHSGAADADTRLIMEKTAGAARKDFEGVLVRLLPSNIHPSRLADAELVGELLAMFRAVGADAFARQCMAVANRPDRSGTLAQTRVPAMILCGQDDQICPLERSQALARLLPHARVWWVERCGHMSPLEQPAAVTAALHNWIEDLQ